jgi:hypothetical protein
MPLFNKVTKKRCHALVSSGVEVVWGKAQPRWFDRIGTSTVFENLAASCLQGFFSLFLCAFWYGNV